MAVAGFRISSQSIVDTLTPQEFRGRMRRSNHRYDF